jgi:hypothetical protein
LQRLTTRIAEPNKTWLAELLLDFDGVEQGAGLVGCKDRYLVMLDHVLRTTDRAGWIHFNDVAAGQPVEEHPDGGELLLDGRRHGRVCKRHQQTTNGCTSNANWEWGQHRMALPLLLLLQVSKCHSG